MKQPKIQKHILCTMLTIIFTVLFTLAALSLLARYDNKYTGKAQISQQGMSIFPQKDIVFLVDGWELYPDKLLFSSDFAANPVSPLYHTWIGEYPHLSPFHANGSPYGTSTYRIKIKGNGIASLYLPEPLCASRVFVDGVDLGGLGEVQPEHYQTYIQDKVYSFFINNETELIIQTANYSHYYGGIWFPPAIGSADSITYLIACRMIIYGMLCFTSLALSLFCILFWAVKKPNSDETISYFGLLCLSFSLRVCYPFFRLWGVPSGRSLYALEDAAALLGIYCTVRIVFLLFIPEVNIRLKQTIIRISLFLCFTGLIIPLFVLPKFPYIVSFYGLLISWYKVLTAIFLIGAICSSRLRTFPFILPLLSAVTANSTCLLWGVLTIGNYEPSLGAWPEEYGTFCMVIAFAWLMVGRGKAMIAENLLLNEHLQEEVTKKTHHLNQLLSERGKLIAELGHDMKSPLTALSNMVQIIRMGNLSLDEESLKKIDGIEDKCDVLTERLQEIQTLTEDAEIVSRLEPISLNHLLSAFCQSNKPVIELTGPDFLYHITTLNCTIMADKRKLFRALENILFNGVDFTSPEGSITFSLECENEFAIIRIADTGCGIPADELSLIFHCSYTSRAKNGGQGLGLSITRSIILEHQGDICAESTVGKGTVFTIRLPLTKTSKR